MIAWFQTRALPRFQNGYASLVRWAIGHPALVMLGVLVLFIGSFVAVGVRKPHVDFFPKGDPKFIYTYLNMPVGTRVAVTDSITHVLENRVYGVIGRNNPDVESVITNVAIGAGDPSDPRLRAYVAVAHGQGGRGLQGAERAQGPENHTYMDKIREVVKGIPGAEIGRWTRKPAARRRPSPLPSR